MNISLDWLHDYVDFTLSADEVAQALTSIGLEVGAVEEIETIRGGLRGLVVGRVVECEMHPASDHLHVCKVDVAQGELLQIVCGAPNVAQGQKVIVALIGCTLYDGDKAFKIKKSKLRGLESSGMICAEDEIGIGTDHSGIIVLPQSAIVGTPAAEYYNVKSDFVLEVDITPNRADACSHYGVARDLYAYLRANGYETRLNRPDCSAFKVDNHSLPIAVSVATPQGCPRYCALTIKGVTVSESPEWLQRRLKAIGLRPINNIVDITNYILHAYGQPLHCFDADMVEGGKVIVQNCPEGTPFLTLDGVEHRLAATDVLICNEREPMCLAGVFGGKGSGTYETTRNVLLESAYFNPTAIRRSARRHGLTTDASFRFERGIDPNGQIYAIKQAAILIKQIAGGEIAMEIADTRPEPVEGPTVQLDYNYINSLVGKQIPKETILDILQSLEVEVLSESEQGLLLRIPPYRVDVTRPCDVVEDILRIYGYNNVEIPTAIRSTLTVKGDDDRSHRLQTLISEQLVGAGWSEILNNSLTRSTYYTDCEPSTVRLLNPLSEDLSTLRATLLYGGLETIRRNINYKNPNLRLFEFGKCYHKNPSTSPLQAATGGALGAYSEEYHLGLFLTGKSIEGSWAHPDEDSSAYQLKATVQNIFTRLGLLMPLYRISQQGNKQCLTTRRGQQLAEWGVVSPADAKKVGIEQEVFFADLHWSLLMHECKGAKLQISQLSNYPAVSRDLALLVDDQVQFAQIEQVAYQTENRLLRSVELFDVYQGPNLPQGKKSYAVNFRLQAPDKTLTEARIDRIMQTIILQLQQRLGATLR